MTTDRRLLVEQFDPRRPKAGGIDTCIRGLVKYAPEGVELHIAGVDAIGDKPLGVWLDEDVDGVPVKFMALARLDHADLKRRVPHSVSLTWGLLRHRPLRGVATSVQSHRINVGMSLLLLYRRLPHVQFLHSSGTQNLGQASKSFFRHAVGLYRAMERYVVKRSVQTVVFSRPGAERLSALSDRVEFSPTWYDPALFFPAEKGTDGHVSRVLWACRFEPAKDPELTIEAWRQVDGVALDMAGSGTLEDEARQRTIDLPAVTVLGPVEKSRMGEVMREYDGLLMSSHFEGYSRSIVEALASGLPVATTPGGDPNGLVVDGVNGARAADRRPEELAAAVERALDCDPVACTESVRELSAPAVVGRILRPAVVGQGT